MVLKICLIGHLKFLMRTPRKIANKILRYQTLVTLGVFTDRSKWNCITLLTPPPPEEQISLLQVNSFGLEYFYIADVARHNIDNLVND